MIKNFIKMIALSCTLFMSTFALSPIEEMKIEARNQLEGISAVKSLMESSMLLYSEVKAQFAYGLYEYCSYRANDPACDGKDNGTRDTERGSIISYIAWGFNIKGDETDNDYNDANDLPQGKDEFKVIKKYGYFDDKLCVEVHFKDTSEFRGISLAIAGKTVVFCYKSIDPSEELIDINCVDEDPGDACGSKNSHAYFPQLPAGVKCFNPHGERIDDGGTIRYNGDLGNGGSAMGFMEIDDGGTTRQIQMITGVSNIFQTCLGSGVYPMVDNSDVPIEADD